MPKSKAVTPEEERLEKILADTHPGRFRSAEAKSLVKLVLDTSGSMYASNAIEEAKAGLVRLAEAIADEDLLKLSVELSLDAFADRAETARQFGPVDGWSPKALLAELPSVGGGTRIAAGALHAIADVERHRAALREQGHTIRYSQVYFFTDGGDFDSAALDEAARRIRELEARGDFRFFAIGVEGADMRQLSRLSAEPVKLASVADFKNFFGWLLAVSRNLSRSQPGERVEMPNPFKGEGNPDGWAKKWTSIG